MGVEQWTWAAQDRYPGFCLTFVDGRDPAAVAASLGAGELRLMTADEAERAYPLGEPGSVLRCGTYPGGAFCFEDRAPVANRSPAVARLSAGTRLLQVTKSGDGMTVVRHVADGRKVELFEAQAGATPRGEGPYTLAPRVSAVLAEHPGLTGTVAALVVVAEAAGASLGRDTLDGPLPTALTTLSEPAAGPR